MCLLQLICVCDDCLCLFTSFCVVYLGVLTDFVSLSLPERIAGSYFVAVSWLGSAHRHKTLQGGTAKSRLSPQMGQLRHDDDTTH